MMRPMQRPRLLALALVMATLLAYQPALRCGYIWDDDVYVTQNHALRSPDGLARLWLKPGTTPQYYPLVFTTFWAEYHLWGLRPLGYHLDNIFLHAANALLLWCILRRLNFPAPWWTAALFAVHPVNVESVAWITERKNVLSAFFYFLATLAWFRFRPLTDPNPPRDWRFYPLLLALFLCALLGKTVTCSLPAALLLLLWWKTGRIQTRDVLELSPLFALGAASGLMTAWMEKHFVGATGTLWTLSPLQRCLVAGRALWFYAAKLVWPRNLSFNYPRWNINPHLPWQYLFPLAALAVLSALWLLRSRLGRGPLVAVLFFAGTLAPALGFFDVFPFGYSYVADHFQYLAGIGVIALAVATAFRLRGQIRELGDDAGVAAGTVILVVLATLTWRQTHAYQNAGTLWRDTLAKNPQSWFAHNDLGRALAQTGNEPEAIQQFQLAARLEPDYAAPHVNLASLSLKDGNLPAAIEQFQQAVRIDPNDANLHLKLATALLEAGRVDDAIAEFTQTIRLEPDNAQAHGDLGVALSRTDRFPQAIEQFELAVRLDPNLADMHYNLGALLARSGRIPDAIQQFHITLQLQPDFTPAQTALDNLQSPP
jgi:tetratricopeptide (TPR) repeat protein